MNVILHDHVAAYDKVITDAHLVKRTLKHHMSRCRARALESVKTTSAVCDMQHRINVFRGMLKE